MLRRISCLEAERGVFNFLAASMTPSEYLLQTMARLLGALNLETQLPVGEETRMNQHMLQRTDSPQEIQRSSWGDSSKPHPLSSKMTRCPGVVTRCGDCKVGARTGLYLVQRENVTPQGQICQVKGGHGAKCYRCLQHPPVKVPVGTHAHPICLAALFS